MHPLRPLACLFSATILAGAPLAACGRTDEPVVMAADRDASAARGRLDAALRPDASCEVVIETPPLQAAAHVPVNTPITYSSLPPSSGPHYAIWAAYKEYSEPIDPRYLVHDLEHGAILLLHRCLPVTDPACQETVKGLRAARDALPVDPLCASSGVKTRVIIAPLPTLDVPVAAAAWGWTYKAQCVDAPTLGAFAREHYGQGEEVTCADGQGTF